MLNFSQKTQSFYDSELTYPDLPADLVEVTDEQHLDLLNKINSGYRVFSDLTISDQRPSIFHEWINHEWIDNRTEDQKLADEIKWLPALTRRQFRLALINNGYNLSEIEQTIGNIEDDLQRQTIQIEWEDAQIFERTSASLNTMAGLLGLDDRQINDLWKKAMKF